MAKLRRQTNITVIIGVLTSLIIWGCSATLPTPSHPSIRGVSIEAPSTERHESIYPEINDLGANYVCLMPYAYTPTGSIKLISNRVESQWWGEVKTGISEMLSHAKSRDLEVMIKPHTWIRHGEFTGDFIPETELEKKEWLQSYHDYIMDYAHIAENGGAKILCIGTELCSLVADQPSYWNQLISDVKEVYTGKLTYAANWDCFQSIPFWDQLDFIGVDAYFPLEPSAVNGTESDPWTSWKPSMKQLSDSLKMPILLTEYGYRSVKGAMEKPWDGNREMELSYESQSRAYASLYAALWKEPWCAGGFLWKWHCPDHIDGLDRQKDFTPQGKPALEVIKQYYRTSP